MSNEQTKKVVEGEGIVGLFPTPTSKKVEIEYKNQILKFEVMPIDNETYALIGDRIKISNINLDLANAKNSLVGMKIVSDLYYPAIKVVLPKCCVNPKMIDGISSTIGTIGVNRLPLEVAIELFDKILSMSGVGADKEVDRKK